MKNNIILSSLLLFVAMACLAVPAKRVRQNLTLADGTVVMATLTGDENGHWYVDDEGHALSVGEDGIARYLTEIQLKTRIEKRTERLALRNDIRRNRLASARRRSVTRGSDDIYGGYIGKKKGLVILVNFKDRKFTYTRDDFYALANEKGYSRNGAKGSVSDYFKDQSYGKFELDFDVVGPYDISRVMAYYGKNNSNTSGDDAKPGDMITEAVKLADKDVNFADYDWDHDGNVDQVYVIYAGYSEEESSISNTIWSHEWDLESTKYYDNGGNGPVLLDNVWINTYACSSELKGRTGSEMSAIGTMCHEFSHCLGLPDLYDTVGSSFGMDEWSVMSYGSYGGDGKVPSGFTSYERWEAGWLEPVELKDNTTITAMQPITEVPEAYVIYNDANNNEYYLLENRQLTSWDSQLHGHGLLILHVDYDALAWSNNVVNNDASHQRLTIFHADRNNSIISLSGDPYPGTSNNTSLTDKTSPAAKLYNANVDGRKYMNKPITEISESADGIISFVFGNPRQQATAIEAPVLQEGNSRKIYNIAGQYMGNDLGKLPKGIYKMGK